MPDHDLDIAMRRLDAAIPDYSDPSGDDFVALSRDLVPVRSMVEDDLDAVIGIDHRLTGRDRGAYYRAKFKEVLNETGIRVSLVAEIDGLPAGFVMARVDLGEFGRTEPAAVMDTIGVDPGHGARGIGRALMSQLLANLASLRVEAVHTQVTWDNFGLMKFLRNCCFRPSQQVVLTKRVD